MSERENSTQSAEQLERSRCLFDAFLTREKIEADLSPDAPTQVAFRRALEFLAHDSDHHTAELEQQGSQYCDDVIRGTLLAMEYWAHQITLMALTVERAKLVTKLAKPTQVSNALD